MLLFRKRYIVIKVTIALFTHRTGLSMFLVYKTIQKNFTLSIFSKISPFLLSFFLKKYSCFFSLFFWLDCHLIVCFLEDDRFNLEVNEKVSKESFCWIKKILKKQVDSGNPMKTVNSRAAALIRYGTRLIKCTSRWIKSSRQRDKKNNDNVQSTPPSSWCW